MPVELNSSIYKSPEDAKIAEVKMANDVIAMIAAIAAGIVFYLRQKAAKERMYG